MNLRKNSIPANHDAIASASELANKPLCMACLYGFDLTAEFRVD
jgi:hypothetical protein